MTCHILLEVIFFLALACYHFSAASILQQQPFPSKTALSHFNIEPHLDCSNVSGQHPSQNDALPRLHHHPETPIRYIMVDQGLVDFKAKVGRATWTLLHSIAARYPEQASTPEAKIAFDAAIHSLFQALQVVYPCEECRLDMQRLLAEDSPQVDFYLYEQAVQCHLYYRLALHSAIGCVNFITR
jgi:Erv1 / Alr family